MGFSRFRGCSHHSGQPLASKNPYSISVFEQFTELIRGKSRRHTNDESNERLRAIQKHPRDFKFVWYVRDGRSANTPRRVLQVRQKIALRSRICGSCGDQLYPSGSGIDRRDDHPGEHRAGTRLSTPDKTKWARAIAGILPIAGGMIKLHGRLVRPSSPAAAIGLRSAWVTMAIA
jgi:hypothetical protein